MFLEGRWRINSYLPYFYERNGEIMEITIRNITKDNMRDFSNDHTINLPMDEEKLRSMLGNDEWIIVDSPVGEEFTNITKLNEILSEMDENTLMILSTTYLFSEIEDAIENEREFTILCFDDLTSQYQGGLGVFASDEWKGFVLFHEGYGELPFEYKEEMEDYIKWDCVWSTAECEGWREVEYKNKTYLVKEW